MPASVPRLSRFELQCLKQLGGLREASVRQLHAALVDPPSYSTVRKIVERLEAKGAIARVRLEGTAWVYRPAVGARRMLQREIRSFLDSFFEGSAAPLVSHLAEMDALTIEDLREAERQLAKGKEARRWRRSKRS